MAKPRLRLCGGVTFDLAHVTVEPYVLVFTLAVNLYLPTFQALIFHKVCLNAHTEHFCR